MKRDFHVQFSYKGRNFDLLVDFEPASYGSMFEPPEPFCVCGAVFKDEATPEQVSELDNMITEDEEFNLAIENAILLKEEKAFLEWAASQPEE